MPPGPNGNASGEELFKELLRYYPIAHAEDYWVGRRWNIERLRLDIKLFKGFRQEAGLPEPGPYGDRPIAFPSVTASARSAKNSAAGSFAKAAARFAKSRAKAAAAAAAAADAIAAGTPKVAAPAASSKAAGKAQSLPGPEPLAKRPRFDAGAEPLTKVHGATPAAAPLTKSLGAQLWAAPSAKGFGIQLGASPLPKGLGIQQGAAILSNGVGAFGKAMVPTAQPSLSLWAMKQGGQAMRPPPPKLQMMSPRALGQMRM
mmetsp:Transcript_64679/g.179939  ORF Transcript_64679/g.179939 Transcript_64679/m.179939 type:complete len:259 (-) Transcript_64679:111-887(-)